MEEKEAENMKVIHKTFKMSALDTDLKICTFAEVIDK